MDAIFRKLPAFKGKGRLAKLILGNAIAKGKDKVVRGKYGCEYILPNLVENISFEIFINGVYEDVTSDYFARHLPPGGVFLDLGANIGTISVPLQRKRPDVQIVCVEAAPWLFGYLQDNIGRNNLTGIRAVNKALYSKDDEVLDFYSPGDKFGKGSLSPVFTKEGVKVKTITVDSLVREMGLPGVDIIKIDVEGYEYPVFEGGSKLLGGADAPDVLFEFADWAEELAGFKKASAQIILKNYGYSLFEFDEKGGLRQLDGIMPEGNAMLLATKKTRK